MQAPRAMRVVWYAAMSMDGRLSGPHDDMSFIQQIGLEDGDEFEAFYADVDAILTGANTARWSHREGHTVHSSGGRPIWVMSHDPKLQGPLSASGNTVHVREGDIGAVLAEIKSLGHRKVWICGGGDVAGQVLAIDRIDEVLVTIAPTVLGEGPALFAAVELPSCLFELSQVRRYAENAVRLRWVRMR